MVRRFLLLAVIAALAASIIAPVAASSPVESVSAGRLQKVNTFWCMVAIGSGHGKLDSLDAVRIVRDQYDDTAPASADPELVAWVQGWHANGCGPVADTFVRIRTNAAAYRWFLAVVDYWTG